MERKDFVKTQGEVGGVADGTSGFRKREVQRKIREEQDQPEGEENQQVKKKFFPVFGPPQRENENGKEDEVACENRFCQS